MTGDGLRCCHIEERRGCAREATAEVWPEGGGRYEYTHSCDSHLAEMLYEGVNRVYPIEMAQPVGR